MILSEKWMGIENSGDGRKIYFKDISEVALSRRPDWWEVQEEKKQEPSILV